MAGMSNAGAPDLSEKTEALPEQPDPVPGHHQLGAALVAETETAS
jgi:hypothetical protein